MKRFKQFYESSNELDTQLRKLGLKRTNKFNHIGKEIGGEVYCHKQYEDQFPGDVLAAAKVKLPEDFDYQVVKYNPKNNAFSFIKSNDFDSDPEPSVNGGMVVKADGTTKRFGDCGWIYHHKWMWVADDYTGFDVQESKLRSLEWASLPGVDRTRIGQRKFWNTNVIPLLDK
jgi:hypothetical protein